MTTDAEPRRHPLQTAMAERFALVRAVTPVDDDWNPRWEQVQAALNAERDRHDDDAGGGR